MVQKLVAGALLKLSKDKAKRSARFASDLGYCQPKEPEAISKLRNRNVACNK